MFIIGVRIGVHHIHHRCSNKVTIFETKAPILVFFQTVKIYKLPGPNLTKVGTSPLLEWGRPMSPLQWTNGDGSRWRLSAGGVTFRRTAAASA